MASAILTQIHTAEQPKSYTSPAQIQCNSRPIHPTAFLDKVKLLERHFTLKVCPLEVVTGYFQPLYQTGSQDILASKTEIRIQNTGFGFSLSAEKLKYLPGSVFERSVQKRRVQGSVPTRVSKCEHIRPKFTNAGSPTSRTTRRNISPKTTSGDYWAFKMNKNYRNYFLNTIF